MQAPQLAGWENYYVILGSCAGGLIGLTFVVIALIRDAQRVTSDGLSAFVTPTTVHFGGVLALAAFLSMPRHTTLSLSLGIGIGGVAGLLYTGMIGAKMRNVSSGYVPVREDWTFNVILPSFIYGGLFVLAFLMWRWQNASLYAVALLSLGLLFIGIRNAWDIAVWMTTHRRGDKD